MIKTVVTKGREIAKTGKNFLMNSFKKIFKAAPVSFEERLESKHTSQLVLFEQEQSEMVKILGKGIEEARRVRDSLLRQTQEISCEFGEMSPPELVEALREYCAVSDAAHLRESAAAQELLTEVVWKLEDMQQDSAQALKKLREHFQIRTDLQRELRGVGESECEFRVEFYLQNAQILSKEISNFSKRSDNNVREVLKSFVKICSKVSRGRET